VESFTVLNPASTLPFTPSNPFNLVRWQSSLLHHFSH
jgi:hypothetical protein